ncbi:MAG: putative Ig domain-containing protein [Luteolibacter sp.]
MTSDVPSLDQLEATEIGPESARISVRVNAKNADTKVNFEYRLAGQTTWIAGGPQEPAEGDENRSMERFLSNLMPGQAYEFRVRAVNSVGQSLAQGSFRTLIKPTVTLAAPSIVTSRSAVLNGFVNPHGSPVTSLVFEYGLSENNLNSSVGATPSTVAGETNTSVSALLQEIKPQGATFFYRLKAISAGGVGYSTVASFSLNILSGFARVFPLPPQEANGSVLVTLTPSNIGGWRFIGEQQWRNSGTQVSFLATGDRNIEFRPVPGYIQPPQETVSVVSGGPTTVIEGSYYSSTGSGSGALSVTLKPASLADNNVPQALRAQWRLLGETNSQWKDSDAALTDLSPGDYLIECKPVEGRTTPPVSLVAVKNFETAYATLTYFLADPLTGIPPSPVPFADLATDTVNNAYAHVDQIRSNLGSSSGFVVKQRVVATAGHVVFDDGTLSAVTGLQWLFQRQSGSYEPKPQTPRGFYLFDGYASARSAPGVIPGEGTNSSKNLDVAALYFVANATTNDLNFPGRGGFSGYLASDSITNEFLQSPAQKILVGYPVDGIAAGNQGQMHATLPMIGSPPRAVNFTQAFDRTYVTPDIRGSGGMSGGPLCVKHGDGNFYPAAIYLGGTGQTVVRAIDSPVIDMFNRAETSGSSDSNNTGGGITHTSITTIGPATVAGSLIVRILPASAINAGARWELAPNIPSRADGYRKNSLKTASYTLVLNSISGFQPPSPQTITITGGQLRDITFTYAAYDPPPSIVSASSVVGTRGQLLTYQIVANQSPTSYSLTGSPPTGLGFDTSTGLLSGTLQEAGVFIVTLGATNSGGSGTKTLVLTSRPSIPNQSATAVLGQPINWQIISSESGADLSYAAGDLPPGTSLDEDTGFISGSPTQAGVFSSLCTVTKSGASTSAILTITVSASALDMWRLANFQTTSNAGTAADNEDPDNDGQANIAEYAAGTDPKDPSDLFNILTSTRNGTTFTVTAHGKSSRIYVLERRVSLNTGLWSATESMGPLANDGPVVLTDFNSNGTSTFYRLRVFAP